MVAYIFPFYLTKQLIKLQSGIFFKIRPLKFPRKPSTAFLEEYLKSFTLLQTR